jgi:hypothetical protein
LNANGDLERLFSRIAFSLLLVLVFLAGHSKASADDSDSSALVLATVKINPLEVRLSVPNRVVRPGERFSIQVLLRNHGSEFLDDVAIVLHATDEPCIQILGSAGHQQTQLRSRGTISETWRVLAIGQDPACAAIVLTASASAKDPGGEVLLTESAAKILKISQRTKPGIHLDAESQYPFETRANEEPNETFD